MKMLKLLENGRRVHSVIAVANNLVFAAIYLKKTHRTKTYKADVATNDCVKCQTSLMI